ncbi:MULTISPECIES: glycosyltransferase [Clostridia]|uniref:glycosyltransferase n=1 Tax=Clostridia TaxID=186801 RepID=UPI00061DF34B|nr:MULTISPECIES: glycosyltransferase [Clostridia]KJJ77978.1 hypothetical protein CLFS41_00070 [Clostridium sp. FS41]MCB7065276.1 glycosyltransferase [Enterocloster citroniae]
MEFDKKKNKIVVVHYGNIMLYPPVLSLLENLLYNRYNVVLISGNTDRLPNKIKKGEIVIIEFPVISSSNLLMRIIRRFGTGHGYRKAVIQNMSDGDIVWTTTDSTVRTLNRVLLTYKHIMQLMELEEYFPLFSGAKFLKFNLAKYANLSWKTVVPEINRAYIQKVFWKLDNIPSVLPNKPYSLYAGEIHEDVQKALTIIKSDGRKKIMYLGVLSVDRNLEPFARALELAGSEYCLYILGNVPESENVKFKEFLKKYSHVVYLGFFNPPSHLHFLEYAYIGLLPYVTNYKSVVISPLNILYCAPNKIYEYAGYGVPMIGTDVLGLKQPFEKYNIGVCCKDLSPQTVAKKIAYVDLHHETMRKNCRKFYDDTDLDLIVNEIINS